MPTIMLTKGRGLNPTPDTAILTQDIISASAESPEERTLVVLRDMAQNTNQIGIHVLETPEEIAKLINAAEIAHDVAVQRALAEPEAAPNAKTSYKRATELELPKGAELLGPAFQERVPG